MKYFIKYEVNIIEYCVCQYNTGIIIPVLLVMQKTINIEYGSYMENNSVTLVWLYRERYVVCVEILMVMDRMTSPPKVS